MTPRSVTSLLAAAVTTVGVLAVPAAHAATPEPSAAVPFDLDGNGRVDVVSGLPLRGSDDAGAVLVLWGGRNLVPETMLARPGTPTPGQEFGISLASADFDQDGVADLAVLDAEHEADVVAHLGGRPVTATVVGGRVAFST